MAARKEPVWHDDEWFAERGLGPAANDWERRQDEAVIRASQERAEAAPRVGPAQQLALRRIFGEIRRQHPAGESSPLKP